MQTWQLKSWHILATRMGFVDSRATGNRLLRSRAGRMATIHGAVGTVFRGEWHYWRGQSSKAACYLSLSHWADTLQVIAKPHSFHKAHRQDVRRASAVLIEHYSPQPSEVMQRFCFNSRSRKEGESVAAYVAQLRRLAEFCNFGTTLDKVLRDWLVWGMTGPVTNVEKEGT